MRRVSLRGRVKVQKRYLIHVAGYNLELIMRLLIGAGTPLELWAATQASLLALMLPMDCTLWVRHGNQGQFWLIEIGGSASAPPISAMLPRTPPATGNRALSAAAVDCRCRR